MLIRLLALLFVASLLGCQAQSSKDLTIPVAGRQLALSAEEWQPMENEAEYALNFEARQNRPPRRYRVLTVFLNQMTEDRKSGRRSRPESTLEVFVSAPNEVTVLLRRDHGHYRLLSRELFRGTQVAGVNLSSMTPLSDIDEGKVIDSLQNEIDTTRHLLAERLIAR